jgi:hypothetical protein
MWRALRGKIQKKKATQIPCFFFYHVAGRFGQLSLKMEARSVCVGVDAQLLLVSSSSGV